MPQLGDGHGHAGEARGQLRVLGEVSVQRGTERASCGPATALRAGPPSISWRRGNRTVLQQ